MKINSTPYATYSHEFQEIIKNRQKQYTGDIATKTMKELNLDEVIHLLFYNFDGSRNYDVLHRSEGRKNRTFFQRLFFVAIMPVTAILYPLQYIAVGRSGWSENNVIGHNVLKWAGYLNANQGIDYEKSRHENPDDFRYTINNCIAHSNGENHFLNSSLETVTGEEITYYMANGFNGFGHYKMRGYKPNKVNDDRFYHRFNTFWATPLMATYLGIRYLFMGNKPIHDGNKFTNFIFKACNIKPRAKRPRQKAG